MGNRTEVREQIFKYIFSDLFNKKQEKLEPIELKKELEYRLKNFALCNSISEDVVQEIEEVLLIIDLKEEEIIKKIEKNLKEDWTIERINRVDQAILKLAITEMIYLNVPYKVVTNEAVELAKKYGTDNSSKFVNGILASVIKQEKLEESEN